MNQSKPRIEQFIDDWRIYYYNNKSDLYYLYKEYCRIYYSDKCNIESYKIFGQKIIKYYDQKKCKGYNYIALNDKYKELYDNDEVRDNAPENDDIDRDLLEMINHCDITIKGKKHRLDTSVSFSK